MIALALIIGIPLASLIITITVPMPTTAEQWRKENRRHD